MSDVPELDAAGLPEELSAVRPDTASRRSQSAHALRDHDAWSSSTPPRTGSASGRGSTTPRARCFGCGRRSSCRRCRPVAPRWVDRPDFNLDFHVRRMRVPSPGRCARCSTWPRSRRSHRSDISRPLWTATLVEGLEGGRRRTDGAPQPRRDRRRRRRRDVRQHLRPRA